MFALYLDRFLLKKSVVTYHGYLAAELCACAFYDIAEPLVIKNKISITPNNDES